jgi:hypothetical protein
MMKIITTIAFFICSLVSAQGQFEQGMGKSVPIISEGKIPKLRFERIQTVQQQKQQVGCQIITWH